MKNLFFILCFGIMVNVDAIPTIGMPDLTMEQQSTMSQNTDDQQLTKSVMKTMPKFSAEIRGALIKTGQFKVIDVDSSDIPEFEEFESANVESMVLASEIGESKSIESKSIESSASVNTLANHIQTSNKINKRQIKPKTDYYLIGVISYVGENEDSYPIKQTDNMTKQYVIEVTAEFKLIRVSDKTVMASFSSNGKASDVKIVSTSDKENRVWHHNIGKLVNSASKELANNVVEEMESQFNFTILNEEKAKKANESIVVTDVKVYN